MGNAALKTAAYFTLGCKLNFSETSTIGKILAAKGIALSAGGDARSVRGQHLLGNADGRQEGAFAHTAHSR